MSGINIEFGMDAIMMGNRDVADGKSSNHLSEEQIDQFRFKDISAHELRKEGAQTRQKSINNPSLIVEPGVVDERDKSLVGILEAVLEKILGHQVKLEKLLHHSQGIGESNEVGTQRIGACCDTGSPLLSMNFHTFSMRYEVRHITIFSTGNYITRFGSSSFSLQLSVSRAEFILPDLHHFCLPKPFTIDCGGCENIQDETEFEFSFDCKAQESAEGSGGVGLLRLNEDAGEDDGKSLSIGHQPIISMEEPTTSELQDERKLKSLSALFWEWQEK